MVSNVAKKLYFELVLKESIQDSVVFNENLKP